MRFAVVALAVFTLCVPSLLAQQQPDADAFAAALANVRQELTGSPPFPCYAHAHGWTCIPDPQDPQHMSELDPHAIVVAQRTIGGAPAAYRAFVDKWFGTAIAEELLQSYGKDGPESRAIEQEIAAGFAVLPLEQFEEGPSYNWQRLNQKYPNVRYIVRLSWPAMDRIGTYAVVRYELIGRNRPPTSTAPSQWAIFRQFEMDETQSWKAGIGGGRQY